MAASSNPEEDWGRLAAALKMNSVAEIETFMCSKFWGPHYITLYEEVVEREQTIASEKSTSGQRQQGPRLAAVHTRIIAGEQAGMRRYSQTSPEKNDWDIVDHYAYFMVSVYNDNVLDADGIFYGEGLAKSECYQRIWWLLRRCTIDTAPSRLKGSKTYKLLLEKRPVKQLKPSTDPNATNNTGGRLHSTPPPVKQGNGNNSSGGNGNRGSEVGGGSGNRGNTPGGGSGSDGSNNDGGSGNGRNTPGGGNGNRGSDNGDWNRDEDRARSRSASHLSDEDQPTAPTDIDINTHSNFQIMVLERKAPPNIIDLNERYHQFTMIEKVCTQTGGWQNTVAALQTQWNNDRLTSALSVAWQREMEDINKEDKEAIYAPLDVAAIREFDKQQEYLNNKNYQRDNVDEAYKKLELIGGIRPRFPNMKRSRYFKPWQPVAILRMCEIRQIADGMRGCILADVVGLGKTWISIGYMIYVIHIYQTMAAATRPKSKPFLLVVPAKLIKQWEGELRRIAPSVRIYKYYGDYRAKPTLNEVIINKALTKDHSLFRGDPANTNAVILTSYGTMQRQHGPRAQYDWQLKFGRWEKLEAKKDWQCYDAQWPGGLAGCFETVILDEAHLIKNTEAEVHGTIAWLHARFHLCMTATPLISGARDFAGYLALLEPSNAEALWDPQQLSDWKLGRNVNPYELEASHPGRKLCLTTKAAQRFIFTEDIPGNVAGSRLHHIWKECLIRRTYASKVPFGTGPTIEEYLPRVKASVMETLFTGSEQREYDRQATLLLQSLVYTDEKTKRPKWSFGTMRKLHLACLWTKFECIEKLVKASSVKGFAEDPNFVFQWLKQVEQKMPGFTCPEQHNKVGLLAALCDGSPKLRLLLQIIASRVIHDQQKILIWVSYPATQLFLLGALNLMGVSAHLFAAYQTSKVQADLITQFTTAPESTMILIGTYSMGSVGLNLQALCWNVILFDPPPSQPIGLQAIGRVRRIGNPRATLIVVELSLKNTFNERITQLNIKKAIPSLMAELNLSLFKGKGEGTQGDMYGEDFSLGEWVLVDGQLVSATDPSVQGHNLPTLEPEELLRHLLEDSRGKIVKK